MAEGDPAAAAAPGAPRPDAVTADREPWLFVGGLIGVSIGAAVFAIVFRASLALAYRLLYHADNVLDAIAAAPRALVLVLPAAGGLVSGFITQGRRPRAQNASNVMEAVALGRVHLSMRATASRVAASWCAMAAGLSIGREGPLIEFGGSLGKTIAERIGVSSDRLRVLVAAGTAAGFGSAYNTPFAAVLFVLETMVGIAALDALLPMMAAVVISVALTRAVVGGGPIYGQRAFVLASPRALVLYGVVAVSAAAVALLFKAMAAGGEALVARYPIPFPWCSAIGGLIVGAIAVAVPEVAGNGSEPLNLILDQRLVGTFLLILVLAKMTATAASVSSGIPGGMFTPVLLVGGATGALWGAGLRAAGLVSPADAGGFALVAMAATSAAMTHAPMTAAVMVFELSGDYPIVLPLLFATVIATSISRALRSESIYDAELRRRGVGWSLTLDGRRIEARRREGA
jgi:CIC family chloride channel protein